MMRRILISVLLLASVAAAQEKRTTLRLKNWAASRSSRHVNLERSRNLTARLRSCTPSHTRPLRRLSAEWPHKILTARLRIGVWR